MSIDAHCSVILHVRYGLKARSGLRKIVELAQAQLSAYGTSVAEDEALLREPGCVRLA